MATASSSPLSQTTHLRSTLLAALLAPVLATSPALAAGPSPDVPAGFVADVLVAGQIDGITPRLEAIRNPAYGSGIITAAAIDGIVTVRRITSASIDVLSSFSVGSSDAAVFDAAFDTTGILGGELLISVRTDLEGRSTIFRVAPDGSVQSVGDFGGPTNHLIFLLAPVTGDTALPDGIYLFDASYGPEGASSIWRLNPGGAAQELAFNSVVDDPAGRIDMDIRGLSHDAAGQFGGGLVVCDADANNSATSGIYTLDDQLQWDAIIGPQPVDDAYFRDLEIAFGGALGDGAFVVDGTSDTIDIVGPDGSRTVFASGFEFSSQYVFAPGGAASLTIDPSGDVLYAADDAGIHRIRVAGDEPGPQIVATEPRREVVHVDSGGLTVFRLIWSEPIEFAAGDIVVTDATGAALDASVTGSGTAFTLVSLAAPLQNGELFLTVEDAARSVANDRPVDGDADGVAGGDASLRFRHECRADIDGSGEISLGDLLSVLAAWGPCP
ncbi:MAG: hypothetical protein AB8G96_12135 [Phycisphaerales bacterium]